MQINILKNNEFKIVYWNIFLIRRIFRIRIFRIRRISRRIFRKKKPSLLHDTLYQWYNFVSFCIMYTFCVLKNEEGTFTQCSSYIQTLAISYYAIIMLFDIIPFFRTITFGFSYRNKSWCFIYVCISNKYTDRK